jgi:hypothetical protein
MAELRSKRETPNDRSERISLSVIASVISALILGAGAMYITYDARLRTIENLPLNGTAVASQEVARAAEKVEGDPRDLIRIVQEQQRRNVRESYGELRHQSFTADDLKAFEAGKTDQRIAQRLRSDPGFLNVVLAIRRLPANARATLLAEADVPLRPTWATLGGVSREGQTDAGHEAERRIAAAIVDLVRRLSSLSDEEFLRLYKG